MNLKKILASTIAAILILLAPGIPGYAAAASIITRAAPVSGPTAGAQAGAHSLALPQSSLSALTLTPLSLTQSGLTLTPAVAPAISVLPTAPALAPTALASALVPAVVVAPIEAGAPSLPALLQQKDALALPEGRLNNMGDSQARGAGQGIMDRIFGSKVSLTGGGDAGDVLPSAGIQSVNGSGLVGSDDAAASQKTPPPAPPSGTTDLNGSKGSPRGSKVWALAKSLGRVALGVGAVLGLQALSVALLPAVFGVVPVAAVWAVSGGLLLLPAALYARYRLSLRDSPKLDKVRWALDAAIGLYLGAVAIALPSLSVALLTANASAALIPAAAAGAGLLMARNGGTGLVDSLFTWGALAVVPGVLGIAAAGILGLGPLLGMLAIPAMTTFAFFLGRIIHAAETGQPFSVPGTMQKLRFPSFNWVMTGVVFSLLTGYGAVFSNWAFIAWQLLGNRTAAKWDKTKPFWKNALGKLTFNVLYTGLFIFTAATGFSSPLTFIVIAFAPERAAFWMERLLVKLFPKSQPAPSTMAAPAEDPGASLAKARWPVYHHWARTFILLGTMAGMGFLMATGIFGFASLLKNLGIAAVLAAVPFFLSNWLVKKMMKATPAKEEQDPEFFSIMRELRETINAKRLAQGKKPIPMPELVAVPMEAPNAFATGRSPFHATVGQTAGIKEMLLDAESARAGLVRLLASVEGSSKAYKVFRRAIAGSIPGVTAQSSPRETAQAILRADAADVKKLGVRMLRGVHSHEFSHVMDRHMVTGSIAGAISSGVAFASYGVMWAVGHAQALAARLWKRITGKRDPDGTRVHVLDPVSTGVVLKSLPALLKVFAALWGPLILQITQLAGTRNNEGQADEDGARLSGDPEALALALGMLTTWRPAAGFRLSPERLPLVAATAHLFTVNTLSQLEAVDALPQDAFSQWALGKGDDFLLDLFMTHPDTRLRIEHLGDMADAMEGNKDEPPNNSPPLASAASPSQTDSAIHGRVGSFRGFFRKAWVLVSRPFRVLPDKDRNREFWKYTLGQALLSIGVNFHYTALPKLVAPNKEDTALMGYNRAGNWGAQAVSSLSTGPLVDRSSVQKVMGWTGIGRALLMFVVPILFFHGFLSFGAFFAVIALAGFLQAMNMNAGSVAFNRILGPDESSYNRANAVFNVIMNVVGVVAPLLAGAFIGAMDVRYGLLAGNALSYGIYGAALAVVSVGYLLWLRIPRDDMLQSRRELQDELKKAGDHRIKGVSAQRLNGQPTLLVEVAGDPEGVVVPAEFAGYPVKIVAQRRIWKELAEGFQLIWKNRFLRLYLLFSTIAVMTGESLIFTVLPRYIADMLGSVTTTFTGLHNIPFIGAAVEGLTSKSGAFGLYLAAASLGLGLSSILMVFMKDKAGASLSKASLAFRLKLSNVEGMDDLLLERAEAALRRAPADVMARYRKAWGEDPEKVFTAEGFRDDVLSETALRLDVDLFEGKRGAAETRRLMDELGLSAGLSAWAMKHFPRMSKSARIEARTGMDSLQRQGRWSSVLHGLGWLLYCVSFGALPMVFGAGLWVSVGAMMLASILQGPAIVIWNSLLQKVIGKAYPESMGKVYSALSFYQLLFAIAGVLAFGALAAAVSTPLAVMITIGVLLACAVLDIIEPWFVFPFSRRGKKQP